MSTLVIGTPQSHPNKATYALLAVVAHAPTLFLLRLGVQLLDRTIALLVKSYT